MRAPLVTAMLAAVAMLAIGASTARADVLKVGDRLVELDGAVDAANKPLKLKSFKGKWVVVSVGADWCKPCAKELPTWDRLASSYKDKVVFVAVDIDADIAVGKKFHDKLKLKNMVRAYVSPGAAGAYGGERMPSTFVADGNGVIRLFRGGFEEGDADGEYKKFKDALDKLVK